jgi:hypothetical protein
VGEDGALMLNTCIEFEFWFTTYAYEPETATKIGAAPVAIVAASVAGAQDDLDSLNTLAEVSLRIFNGGLEKLAERFAAPGGICHPV